CKYVSPKVIVAKVFYGRARLEGSDAQAIQDHGSHTAGIAAGVTGKTAVVNGVNIDDMSGIAPGAWLGNYNVFPGDVLNGRRQHKPTFCRSAHYLSSRRRNDGRRRSG